MEKNKPVLILLVIYTIFLIGASFVPVFGSVNNHETKFEFRIDYLLHFSAYFSFYIIYILSLVRFKIEYNKNSLIILSVIAAFIAVTTELVQYYIPERSMNPFDILWNYLGIFSGIIITLLYRRVFLT